MTCVWNWCKIILNVWFVPRWPEAVARLLKCKNWLSNRLWLLLAHRGAIRGTSSRVWCTSCCVWCRPWASTTAAWKQHRRLSSRWDGCFFFHCQLISFVWTVVLRPCLRLGTPYDLKRKGYESGAWTGVQTARHWWWSGQRSIIVLWLKCVTMKCFESVFKKLGKWQKVQSMFVWTEKKFLLLCKYRIV